MKSDHITVSEEAGTQLVDNEVFIKPTIIYWLNINWIFFKVDFNKHEDNNITYLQQGYPNIDLLQGFNKHTSTENTEMNCLFSHLNLSYFILCLDLIHFT